MRYPESSPTIRSTSALSASATRPRLTPTSRRFGTVSEKSGGETRNSRSRGKNPASTVGAAGVACVALGAVAGAGLGGAIGAAAGAGDGGAALDDGVVPV